jgi:hypothetical protein
MVSIWRCLGCWVATAAIVGGQSGAIAAEKYSVGVARVLKASYAGPPGYVNGEAYFGSEFDVELSLKRVAGTPGPRAIVKARLVAAHIETLEKLQIVVVYRAEGSRITVVNWRPLGANGKACVSDQNVKAFNLQDSLGVAERIDGEYCLSGAR